MPLDHEVDAHRHWPAQQVGTIAVAPASAADTIPHLIVEKPSISKKRRISRKTNFIIRNEVSNIFEKENFATRVDHGSHDEPEE